MNTVNMLVICLSILIQKCNVIKRITSYVYEKRMKKNRNHHIQMDICTSNAEFRETLFYSHLSIFAGGREFSILLIVRDTDNLHSPVPPFHAEV